MVYKKGFKTLEFKIISAILALLCVWQFFCTDPALWAWSVFVACTSYSISRSAFKKNRFNFLNVSHECSEFSVIMAGILILLVNSALKKGSWDVNILKSIGLCAVFVVGRGHSKSLTPKGNSY